MKQVDENILEKLKPSRKKPITGDIFVLKVRDRNYFWGVVVKEDVNSGFGEAKAYLIYIYNYETKTKSEIPPLKKENLLIPPLMVNEKPWTLGFFENIKRDDLLDFDTFTTHCFKSVSFNKLFDEYGNVVSEKKCKGFPIGEYGLASYGAVSREIKQKLFSGYG